jgi:2-oxoglutarate ferredoxin oxidoreductase subunit beta
LAGIEGTYFIAREAANSRTNLEKCRSSIIKAITLQMGGHGFNAVEVLGICPTNWHMSPREASKRLEQEVMKEFPVGVKKDLSRGMSNG